MPCDPIEFFGLHFRELERRSIPYVILHSYEELPEKISADYQSDIDFAVPDWALRKLPAIQAEVARKHGWVLAQTIYHDLGCYAVLVNLENPVQYLKLDSCSSYARARRLLVSEKVLVANRIPFRGFYVPKPAAEFIYVLAKLFDAKYKSPAEYIRRLKELWSKDPALAQKYFDGLFGRTGRNLEQWFASPAEDWSRLRVMMLARNRFGPRLWLREAARVLRRIFQPTGICIVILGSDGAGKSTLLSWLKTLLEPCFRYQKDLHFRPSVLRRWTEGLVTDPHGKPPRNVFLSWLKVCCDFVDWWVEWVLMVVPARICSALVFFDRSFDDLLEDERRYRLQGTAPLVRVLRRLLPRPDLVFILSAPAEVLHQRKPELTIEKLDRQRRLFRELAGESERHILISADKPPDEVARSVCLEVLRHLARRQENRI
jgi:thymidylate kinase